MLTRALIQRGNCYAPALALALLAGCGSGGSNQPVPGPAPSQLPTHFSSNAAIWFHPIPAATFWPGEPGPKGGSTDFGSLFDTTSAWPKVEARTSVFGLYAGWVIAAGDQQLATVVTFLNAHHMSIELESPSLQGTTTCGDGVEGYVAPPLNVHDVTLGYLNRLKALGANVAYVKVDEPFFYGTLLGVPGSCDFPVATAAAQVSTFSKLVATVYPNAAVGDVEPVVNAYPQGTVAALTQWHEVYATANGKPFPFYFADIDFSNPAWPSIVLTLEDTTRSAGMKFGIIYIGDITDTSDAEWSGKVVSRFQTYQLLSGGRPDYVLFQSWEPHPAYCLPETAPTTFTGTINAYVTETTP